MFNSKIFGPGFGKESWSRSGLFWGLPGPTLSLSTTTYHQNFFATVFALLKLQTKTLNGLIPFPSDLNVETFAFDFKSNEKKK